MLPGTPHTFIGSTTFVVRGLIDAESRRTLVDRVLAVDGVESVTANPGSDVVTVRAGVPVDRADVSVAAAGRASPSSHDPGNCAGATGAGSDEGRVVGRPAPTYSSRGDPMSTDTAPPRWRHTTRRPTRSAAPGRSLPDADGPVHGRPRHQRRERRPARASARRSTSPAPTTSGRSAPTSCSVGGLLLFGGRLADLFDRRTMFLTGLTLFTTASLVSGTASSATALILSRAAQGAGAATAHPRRAVHHHDHVRRPAALHRPGHLGHHRQHGHRRRRPLRRHPHHARSTGARSSSSTSRSASSPPS